MDACLVEKSESIIAKEVFDLISSYRRLPKNFVSCHSELCHSCMNIHYSKILDFIKENKPIVCILPAFPSKSPNKEKVLGNLPDFAEKISLGFLNKLCAEVSRIYPVGMKILICSDGRVFNDLLDISESNISDYKKEIQNIITNNQFHYLSTFDLDDVYPNLSFCAMREKLMTNYGNSKEVLRNSILAADSTRPSAKNVDAKRMFLGIKKFLFEDSLFQGQKKSKAQLHKESKLKAYELILRSNAWSDILEDIFPDAVRLSIHPHVCGSKKFGIRLVADESWITPWHGVVLESNNGFRLVKKKAAEELGAKLIFDEFGKASHYSLKGVH